MSLIPASKQRNSKSRCLIRGISAFMLSLMLLLSPAGFIFGPMADAVVDKRKPIGEIKLSGDFLVKKGQLLNIRISLRNAVNGSVHLYSGENYLGRELIAFVNMSNSRQKTISFRPDWIGSKHVFALFSGDKMYKGNVSKYITLEVAVPKNGIGAVKSLAEVDRQNQTIRVKIESMDKYYVQNATVFIQMKNIRGEIVYLAWIKDIQIGQSSSQTFSFAVGEIPRGIIELHVWRSLEGAALAEVTTIHS